MKSFQHLFVIALVFVTFQASAQFTQAPLPYAFDALQPHIDKTTMEIHYGRHHAGYITNLNKEVAGKPEEKMSINALVKTITKESSSALRNNGGGHWNHTFFWDIMGPNKGGVPSGILASAINKDFGSFDEFKAKFKAAAGSRFGSGWAWLIVKDGKLVVTSTPNQDNPLMPLSEVQGTPILGLDVWEHAYYLNYQNKRPDYIDAFWNIVNWDKVSEFYAAAMK